MRKALLLMVLTALMLSACATTPPEESPAATATTAVENTATATPEPMQAEASPTPELEVQEQPQTPPQASLVTFKIVPGESRVRYEVGETFINQNNRFNLAVGVTTEVSGEIFANLQDPPASQIGPIQVDISKFTSDSSRRDGVIRNQWLESARYPIAVFEPRQIEGLPEDYQLAQPYSFRVTGDLMVREVTREVTFEISAQLDGDTLTGTAETTILMSDFAVGPISILGVLNTEDEVRLIFDFVARP